jgi:four helix bundle protein
MRQRIESYKDLRVYQNAMDGAMRIIELTKTFPAEEKFGMVDQMRRSSRSVCTNLAEAWRKRRYAAHFVSKVTDAAGEAEETRVWLEFAYRCGYMTQEQATELDDLYDQILGQLVNMESRPEEWIIH